MSYWEIVQKSGENPAIIYNASIHIQLSSLSILLYDHAITFGDELEFIWKRRKSLTSYLFLLNRYIALAGNVIFALLIAFPVSPSHCALFNLIGRKILLELDQALVCIILLARVCAVYHCRRRVLRSLIGVICAAFLVSCIFLGTEYNSSSVSCTIPSMMDNQESLFVPWLILLLIDTTIFLLIMYKMYTEEDQGYLLRRIFSDGGIYYVLMTGINTANILTFFVANNNGQTGGLFSSLASCISVAAASRLTLNLRKTAESLSFCPSTSSQLEFSFSQVALTSYHDDEQV